MTKKVSKEQMSQHEPITVRIGRHYYPAGTTLADLLRSAETTATAVVSAMAVDGLDLASRYAREGAAKGLDATDRSRGEGHPETTYIWTAETDDAAVPARGETVYSHAPWNWHVDVLGMLEDYRTEKGRTFGALLAVRLHEDSRVATPTPRSLSFGFWGTWRHAGSRIS